MRLAMTVLVKSSQRLKLYLLWILGLVYCGSSYVGMMQHKKFGFYGWMIVVISLLWVVRLIRGQLADTVSYKLEIDDEGRMVLHDMHLTLNEQDSYAISIDSPIVVWSQLILLHVRDESGIRRRLLIFRDAVSADEFRRLRVALTYLSQRRQRSLIDPNQMSEGNF